MTYTVIVKFSEMARVAGAPKAETLLEEGDHEDEDGDSDKDALSPDMPNITPHGEISVEELLRWCSLSEAEQVTPAVEVLLLMIWIVLLRSREASMF